LRNRIAEDDLEAIAKEFRSAADIRNAVPATSKGFLTPLSDVFVYTPDEPGALLSIITALSDAGADVKDIELLKIREGTGGTFRLGFKDDTSATGAVTSLADAGLHAYRL
jgi:prephenate dehydrogenase